MPNTLLSTERVDENILRRTYRREDGSTFTTIEMPETVARAFGMGKVQKALRTFERGIERRREASRRKGIIIDGLAAGKTRRQIAKEAGVSVTYVSMFATLLNDPCDSPPT